jgi:cysteine-S-conjugate beta-lyase
MPEYNFDEVIDRCGTHAIKYDLRKEVFGTDDVIPMWVADMDFRTPPFIMEAIRQRANHEILGYTNRGDGFFQSLIDWFLRRHKWEIDRSWIIFSPGIVPALSFAIRAFTLPGEKVIIQPPVYHPFSTVITGNQRIIVNNPLILIDGRYYMDLDNLKEQIDDQVKLILISHPHNPVSRVWTQEELSELAKICLENNITIISDEIHSDIIMPGCKHVPLASISPAFSEITVTCLAPSKTFNIAGLSTSAVVIPDKNKRELFNREIETGHLWLGNIFGNIALEAAYKNGDEWVDQLNRYLLENFKFLDSYLKQNIPEIKLIWPDATYLAWLDMRELNMNDKSLKEFMIYKAGIGCNEGISFGTGGEGFMRMNIGCPKKVLQKAINQLNSAVNNL